MKGKDSAGALPRKNLKRDPLRRRKKSFVQRNRLRKIKRRMLDVKEGMAFRLLSEKTVRQTLGDTRTRNAGEIVLRFIHRTRSRQGRRIGRENLLGVFEGGIV